MKKNLTQIIPAIFFAVILFPVVFMASAFKPSDYNKADTAKSDSVFREVLTSQQLFVVKARPIKRGKIKTGKIYFDAELRNAFQVIKYANDTSILELDWVMCPDGNCPEAKLYEPGTKEYAQLDSVIKSAKVRLAKEESKLRKLAK